MIDDTSLRKLAHIQRLILLNSFYNLYYRYHCRHLSYNIWPGSTTGPEIYFYFIFTFFQTQLLAYSLEKCLHLVLAPRIHHETTHTWTQTADFGIVNRIAMVAKSKSMFSIFLQMNIPNNQDNLPQIQHFLSSTKGIPQIFAIFGTIPIYLMVFLVESKPNPNIRDWTPTLQQISQVIQGIHFSYRHLLTWQYQRSVLDHNPNAFTTVWHSCEYKWIANTHFSFDLSIVMLRGVCNP